MIDRAAIDSDVRVKWLLESVKNGESGIVAVRVMTPSCVVQID